MTRVRVPLPGHSLTVCSVVHWRGVRAHAGSSRARIGARTIGVRRRVPMQPDLHGALLNERPPKTERAQKSADRRGDIRSFGGGTVSNTSVCRKCVSFYNVAQTAYELAPNTAE